MKKYFKILLFGLFTWLVPIIISLFFYSRDGKLVIDISLFKSIMIVVGGMTGGILLVKYFKRVGSRFVYEGVRIGLIWLIINIVLDLVTIVPMSKMAMGDYISQIGLRYLMIPIMSVSIGYVAKNVDKALRT